MLNAYMKIVLFISFSLVSTFTSLHAHTPNRIVENGSEYLIRVFNELNLFPQINYSIESEHQLRGFCLSEIEFEIKEDNEASIANSFHSNVAFINIVDFFKTNVFLSDSNYHISPYTFSEEKFECWYILYQVFRI
jgi:hypothetical protein